MGCDLLPQRLVPGRGPGHAAGVSGLQLQLQFSAQVVGHCGVRTEDREWSTPLQCSYLFHDAAWTLGFRSPSEKIGGGGMTATP